jgi:CRP/FNR family transcriptional regulator
MPYTIKSSHKHSQHRKHLDLQVASLSTLTEKLMLFDTSYELPIGQLICASGQKFFNLFVLKSGAAKSTTFALNGKEIITDFYLPGDIIGLDAISRNSYPFNTITLEDSVICNIPYKTLLALNIKFPRLQSTLNQLISQRLLLRTQVEMNNRCSAEQRLSMFLIHILYHSDPFGRKDTYQVSFSRHDIASYLNLTPETVSRTLTKLQMDGCLTVDNNIIKIINHDSLRTKGYAYI